MVLREMLDLLDYDEICACCIYGSDCKGIACYGGSPVEPPCCNGDYERILDFDEVVDRLKEEGLIMLEIKGIWFNKSKGITVVKWEDGSITKVATQNNERFDEEKGIALCFMKQYCGNTGKYNDIIKKYSTKEE